jgi:ATP phosphoribosyltransferase
MKLKIGIPKGSLQEQTLRLFKKAGFNISIGQRSYFPSIDDSQLEAIMFRAQEMSYYVEKGMLDCGLTGNDWIEENASDVIKVKELIYARTQFLPVRWVIAVRNDSDTKTLRDLEGKRIATELVNVTKKFLKKNGIQADVEFSWGATEVKVASGMVDAIVELTETGQSLKANNLRIIDTIITSTTQLIANKNSWVDDWKRKKIEEIALLLEGAINAESKVGLKMNVEESNLETILRILPAMRNPTVSELSQKGWYAIETIVDEKVVRDLIPKLRELGAEGIIEYPLNKVIP